MDEMDIMKRLTEYFELLNPSSSYLISFSPFFVNQASSSLMKYMVNERGKSGLYVCIGRPHIFIEKIFSSRNVDSRSITFMDMALHIGGKKDRFGNNSRIDLPEERKMELPARFRLFRHDQELKSVSFDDIDFVCIDNLTELFVYNSREQIGEFIKSFFDITKEMNKGLFLYDLKSVNSASIMEWAEEMGIEQIEIPDSVLRD